MLNRKIILMNVSDMKNIKYFENIYNVGTLYLDYVFYEFESEPILFVCKDIHDNLYFCICTEIRGFQIWLVASVTIPTLSKLVNGEIDLSSVFSNSSIVHVITMELDGTEYNDVVCGTNICDEDLPDRGTFLRCNKGRAEDYLWLKALHEMQKGHSNRIYGTTKSLNISFDAMISTSYAPADNLCSDFRITSNSLFEVESKYSREQQDQSYDYSAFLSLSN